MNPLRYLFPLAAAGMLSNCQQQQQTYPVYWLEQADSAQAGASFTIMYRGRPYVRQPLFSQKHFEKFKSFLNDDGSYGVVLYLKKEYRNRLYYSTMNKSGMYLLPVVNGLAFSPINLDVPINNGQLVIWGGLNGYDLKRMADMIEPADPEMEKKRFKNTDPRPKRELPKDHQAQKDESGRTIPELF